MSLIRTTLVVTLLANPSFSGIIDVELDGSGSGTFAGIGTNVATYSDTVQVQNTNTGALDNFQLVLTLVGSGPITLAATGLGIGDSRIDNGESLSLSVSLTPSAGTTSNIASFQLTEFGHGLTQSDFPRSFVGVSDGGTTNILDNGITGPTQINNLQGRTIEVSTSTSDGSVPPGSVEGITSLSFDTTAVPEPSSFFMCGMLAGALGFRRKRRSAA